MSRTDRLPNACELTKRLRAEQFAGRLTADQVRERLKADAERPIDLDMLIVFCDAYEERLCAYSDLLQTVVEIATDQREPDVWQRREIEVDEHANRMMSKLPLWKERIGTVFDFLTELRAGSVERPVALHGASPGRIGNGPSSAELEGLQADWSSKPHRSLLPLRNEGGCAVLRSAQTSSTNAQ